MNRNTDALKLAVPVNKTDHIVGPESAKVVLVQYGDFECPTCGQAYPAVKMLLKKFEHRLRFVFRHFPLDCGTSPRRTGGGGGRSGRRPT